MSARATLLLTATLLSLLTAGWASRAQGIAVQERRAEGVVPEGGRLAVVNPLGDVRLRAGGQSGRKVEVFSALQPSSEGVLPEVRLVQEAEGTLRVVAQAPPSGGRAGRADLVLFVPGSVSVSVSTEQGAVEVRGLGGAVDARSGGGNIVAKGVKGGLCARSQTGSIVAELESGTQGAQALTTLTGDITAYLWEDASLTVRAATSGEISTDFSLAMEYRRSEEPNKVATVVVGGGAGRLALESKQGRVRILRLPRGFEKEGPDAKRPE